MSKWDNTQSHIAERQPQISAQALEGHRTLQSMLLIVSSCTMPLMWGTVVGSHPGCWQPYGMGCLHCSSPLSCEMCPPHRAVPCPHHCCPTHRDHGIRSWLLPTSSPAVPNRDSWSSSLPKLKANGWEWGSLCTEPGLPGLFRDESLLGALAENRARTASVPPHGDRSQHCAWAPPGSHRPGGSTGTALATSSLLH